MDTLLIKNGYVVTENAIERADVLIRGSRIAKIAPTVSEDSGEVIDASGLMVMPGLVDMHCHLRDPGLEYKEDIESGTKAALQGGFTSVACMPNTLPPADNVAVIKYIVDRAAETDNAKVYPIACITKGQNGKELSEMGKLKEAGAVAFSDDGSPVSSSNMMRLALEYASNFNALIISHCEDKSLAADGVANEGLSATIAGLKGITRAAEEVMVARDVILAETLGARVHIAHVSTAGSVEIIRNAKRRGVNVTCETCPHYFSATDEEILSFNANAKINPPLREQKDVEAIIEGIKDGTIDAIATDHAPHHYDEKNVEFNLAPFGSVGFETAFAVAYTYLVEPGHIELPKLIELMSANPSKILGIGTGALKEGERADITIADTDAEYTVDSSAFVSKSGNSVFDGWKVKGRIRAVIVDGRRKEIKQI